MAWGLPTEPLSFSKNTPMAPKYPVAGDIYESRLYPGQRCQVISVIAARVTLQWVGQYAHISQQTVLVNQFIRDFSLCPRGGHSDVDGTNSHSSRV